MSDDAARTELVLLDRALARLLERRSLLLERLAPSEDELRRQHADLAARSRRAGAGTPLEAVFELLDRHCRPEPSATGAGGSR